MDVWKALGLTESEEKAYTALLQFKILTGKEIAKQAKIPPTAVYRVLNGLLDKKLVTLIQKEPKTYQPIDPKIAITALVLEKKETLENAEKTALKQLKEIKSRKAKTEISDQVQIITDRRQKYAVIDELITTAKKQVLILSIGEEVPISTLRTAKKITKQGIDYRLIVWKREGNEKALKQFLDAGIQLKYYPMKNMSMAAIDKKVAMTEIKDPQDPSKVFVMFVYSEDLANAYSEYLELVWKKATPITYGSLQ
ncbi:MAG: TrmB family transcriptional regulator [Candidatus Diapherotrites archaeon]|nr:TrmB family transcriptional regulator [Candidatus Diapherotrites archaeon]